MGRTCLPAWKNKSSPLRKEGSGEDNTRCFQDAVSSLQEWHWSMQGCPEAEKRMLANGETLSSTSSFGRPQPHKPLGRKPLKDKSQFVLSPTSRQIRHRNERDAEESLREPCVQVLPLCLLTACSHERDLPTLNSKPYLPSLGKGTENPYLPGL